MRKGVPRSASSEAAVRSCSMIEPPYRVGGYSRSSLGKNRCGSPSRIRLAQVSGARRRMGLAKKESEGGPERQELPGRSRLAAVLPAVAAVAAAVTLAALGARRAILAGAGLVDVDLASH